MAHLIFLEQKIGEALDPIRFLDLDDYSKDYSYMVAAKDNLSMLLIDYYHASTLDKDNPEQFFVWAMDGWLDGLISDCDHDSEINGIITQAYVIEDFKRDFFTACSKEEMADNLYHRLFDFFYDKEPYLELASIEGLFPEGVFDKLRDMNDVLVDDEDYGVRAMVAEQGYGLDKLIDDEDNIVRQKVAQQGYGLDKLINDDYWGVRAEIANQGYGLDKLIHDEEPKVRLLAYDALRAEEEQQKSNQQGKRRVLFVQDNYDDEIENSEFDFDV